MGEITCCLLPIAIENLPQTGLLGHILDKLRGQVAFRHGLMQELTNVLKALVSFMSLLCLPLVVLQWLLVLCVSFPQPVKSGLLSAYTYRGHMPNSKPGVGARSVD